MSKHTPGPWQAHSSAPYYEGYIVGNVDGPLEDGQMNYSPVCDVAETEDFKANCALIAAAPLLLDALKAIRDNTFLDAEGPELRAQNECNHRRAIAAIAKAEGKS